MLFLPLPSLSRRYNLLKRSHPLFLKTLMLSNLLPFQALSCGKFSHRNPSIELLWKDFHKFDLKGNFTIGWLDPCHFFLQFDLEEDFMRIWVKGQLTFQGLPMHIFKWMLKFHVSTEPSIVLVWISFENLQVHLFQKEVLFSLARAMRNPLKLNEPTTNLTRPSIARTCKELDLLKPVPHGIWNINSSGTGFWKQITVGNKPSYCSSCY